MLRFKYVNSNLRTNPQMNQLPNCSTGSIQSLIYGCEDPFCGYGFLAAPIATANPSSERWGQPLFCIEYTTLENPNKSAICSYSPEFARPLLLDDCSIISESFCVLYTVCLVS